MAGETKGAKGTKRGNLRRSGKNRLTGKFKRQEVRTTANKARRVERQDALAARPGITVSRNCMKSRGKRQRLRDFKLALSRGEAKHHDDPRRTWQDRAKAKDA